MLLHARQIRLPFETHTFGSVSGGLWPVPSKPSHLACYHEASVQSSPGHQPCNAMLLVAFEALWLDLCRP
jgi:hypothetical protein